MRKLIMKMSISVDGFVSDANGGNEWIFKTGDEESLAWSVGSASQDSRPPRLPGPRRGFSTAILPKGSGDSKTIRRSTGIPLFSLKPYNGFGAIIHSSKPLVF